MTPSNPNAVEHEEFSTADTVFEDVRIPECLPDEVELSDDELYGPVRDLLEIPDDPAGPQEPWCTVRDEADQMVPRPAAARVPRPPVIFETHLVDEIAPLVERVNGLCAGPRMLRSGSPASPPRAIPRGAAPRITEREVVLDLDLWDQGQPPGHRAQLLSNLLRVAVHGGAVVPCSREPGAAERRRGSLRVPLEFELELRTTGAVRNARLYGARLHVRCAESDRVEAIRRQVDLMADHLANPANLWPLLHPLLVNLR